jgi:hypothetical protein
LALENGKFVDVPSEYEKKVWPWTLGAGLHKSAILVGIAELPLSELAWRCAEAFLEPLIEDGFAVEPAFLHDFIDRLLLVLLIGEPVPGFVDAVVAYHFKEVLVELFVDDAGQ